MKKDTVILSVEEYNKLRDFRKNIENECAIRANHYLGDIVFTKDEFTHGLLETIKCLNIEICELKNPDKKQPSIREIKSMSWWQFRKWKNGKL